MEASQQITVRRSTDIAQLDELEQALLTGQAPTKEDRDPEEVSRELLEQLLAASSDEELERPDAEGWSEFVGVPFELQSFVWHESSFDDGQPIFLVVRATDLRDGRLRVLTTGSAQVMAQLINRARRGTLEGAVLELRSQETKKNRFTVYWLATPEAVAEKRRQDALEEAKAAEQAAGGGEQPAPGDA